MSLVLTTMNTIANPASLLEALHERRAATRGNDIIPVIIVVAIIVLLALAVTVVAGAIIICAIHGGVFDTVANINGGYVTVKCHKL
ncbi:MAG: hypothetical protein JWN80_468 [Microbacteriaceae bacterium]|jgi:uncharacterized RDD family membrane protein YckC|nr:hypothetical protein [Microbacteriaceae bacterium]